MPIAAAGIQVIGVDLSEGMLEVARERADSRASSSICATATCATRRSRACSRSSIDPVPLAAPHGDRRRPPRRPSRGRDGCSRPAAASSSTCSRPAPTTSRETHGRWLEREPGIWERADWDEGHADAHPARPRRGRRDGDVARVALRPGVEGAAPRGGLRGRRASTAGSTARPGAAARTRSGSAARHRRARSRPDDRDVQRLRAGDRDRRVERRARPRPAAPPAPRRAGT